MSEPDPDAQTWPKYGCKFCTSSYFSRSLLNRHLDLYLIEYTLAYKIKTVKTNLVKCHPLQVIRAIRCRTERQKKKKVARVIQWNDLTFTPFDANMDLAVILFDTAELDAFESRALRRAAEWVPLLGFLHSPRKVKPRVSHSADQNSGSEDADEDDSEDEDDEEDEDDDAIERASSSASADKVEDNDGIPVDKPQRKYGAVSRKLFSNVGSSKQLSEGSGSNVVSSKDTLTINSVSNDRIKINTPSRKTIAKLPEIRKVVQRPKLQPSFDDSDADDDETTCETPVTKGRKGKAKEVAHFTEKPIDHAVDAADLAKSSKDLPRVIEKEIRFAVVIPARKPREAGKEVGCEQVPIYISDTDSGDKGIVVSTVHGPSPPASKKARTIATPRTRVAHFFTPGDRNPVVLWLSIIGDPDLCFPVRLGTTRVMVLRMVKEKVGQHVLGFENEAGVKIGDPEWSGIMESGGELMVGLVWEV